MSLAALLNQTADLQSCDYDSDTSAGIKRKYPPDGGSTVASGVAVRIEDASLREKEAYATQNIYITHRIITESTAIQNGYRWSYGGRYFIVNDIARRRAIGGMNDFYVAMCEEVAPNG